MDNNPATVDMVAHLVQDHHTNLLALAALQVLVEFNRLILLSVLIDHLVQVAQAVQAVHQVLPVLEVQEE